MASYGIVYLLKNTITNEVYVGATKESLKGRWTEHCYYAKRGIRQTAIYKAIRQYGKEAFTKEILAHVPSQKDLEEMEQVWIFLLNSFVPNGYNQTYGGRGTRGCLPGEETRKKLSAARRGKSHKGVPWTSKKRRKALAERSRGNKFALGYQHTPEAKQKISAESRSRVRSKHTPEARQKMRESALRRWRTK